MTHIVLCIAMISSLVLLKYRVKGSSKTVVFYLPFLILFIFAAIRYGYGNDYWSYNDAFYSVKSGLSVFETEILFELLLRVFPHYFLFIAFTSFTTVYPVYKLVQNHVHKRYVVLSVFVYCFNPYMFLVSLSAMRQFVAVAVFVLAAYCAYKRKFVKYCILIAIAAMLHSSAALLLPVYFWANNKAVSKKTILYVVLAVVFFLLSGERFNQLMTTILEWFDKHNYTHYFTTGEGSSLRATLLSMCIFLYVALNTPKLEGFRLMSAKLFMVGTILSVWSYHVNMLGRMQYYFDVFSVVAIPAIVQANLEENKKTVIGFVNNYCVPLFICLIYLGRYYNFFTAEVWEAFTEYRTIFEVLW